jgi:hypothetical protein
MSYSVELYRNNTLHIKNDDTFEEINIKIPLSLTKTVGGSYTWYKGPNDFLIKIENFPDEDDKYEVDIMNECGSFIIFYPEDTCEEIMEHLDTITQRFAEMKMAGEVAVAKKLPPHFGKIISQYAGKSKTHKKRR